MTPSRRWKENMQGKTWRIAILKDTSKPMLGLHALHVAFRGLPDVEVVAHVDANPADIREKMACTQARRHYLDYDEMLDRERPDIVVLCSRHPGDHLAQIRAAAARGCHVYCEKPLAADLREADEITAAAEHHGIKICVAHPARYDLAFLTMKRLIGSGAIGTPLTAWGRGKCDHRGGGEDLMVLGTHILDLQTFFFGPPESVLADVTSKGRPLVKSDREEKTVEPVGPAAGDDLFACFRFATGVRGIFQSRRGLPGPSQGVVQMGLTVAGTAGAVSMGFNDAAAPVCRLRLSSSAQPPETGAGFEEVPLVEDRVIPGAAPVDYALRGPDIPEARFFLEANRFAVRDLMEAIAEDRQPVSNARSAGLVQEMIQGIYASALRGERMVFPLADRTHPLAG